MVRVDITIAETRKTVGVDINKNTTVKDVIRKLQNRNQNVDVLYIHGRIPNGNTKLKNTRYDSGIIAAKNYSSRSNRNVQRLRNFLSPNYIADLLKLRRNNNISDIELKQMVMENLAHIVDKYLIPGLNKIR